MSTNHGDQQDLRATLDALRQEVTGLSARLAAIERSVLSPPTSQDRGAVAKAVP